MLFYLGFALLLMAVGVIYMLATVLAKPVMVDVGAGPEDLPIESISIPSESGSQLSGWYIPGNAGTGAVVLAHGVRANRLAMLERARFLHAAGYSVLLFDLQAHGESPGKHITFGYLESRDMNAMIDYMQQRLPNEKLAVIGISLGGASALLSEAPDKADALILEAVFSDLERAVGNRIGARLGDYIGQKLAPLLLWQSRIRLGFKASVLSPVKRAKQVKTPSFVIGGSEDIRTVEKETRKIFGNLAGEKQLWILEGAAHEDFHLYQTEEYERRVLAFLESYLK